MSPPHLVPLRASSLSRKPAPGFTLIEVLVTLLVLSIGLLGLASLQLQGLRGTRDALLHTQATTLVAAMAEHLLARTTDSAPLDAQDLQAWRSQLARWLPDGDGSVTLDAARITVQVSWNERDTPQQYVLSFTP